MKKILSFILALTLCIGILPTFAFAANATEFILDFSEGTSGYVYKDTVVSGSGWSTLSNVTDSSFILSASKSLWRFFNKDYTQAETSKDFYGTGSRDTMAFTITVPQSGVYDISAMLIHYEASPIVQFYIDDAEIGARINLYDETAEQIFSDTEIANGIYLKEGDHKLKVQIMGAKDKNDVEISYSYFKMKTITFTPDEDTFIVDFTTADKAIKNVVLNDSISGDNWSAITNNRIDTNIYNAGNYEWRFNQVWNPYMQILLPAANIANQNSIAFNITVPKTGVYDISANAGKSSAVGIAQFFIDGVSVCSGINLYNLSDGYVFSDVDIASGIYLTEGSHKLTIKGGVSSTTGNGIYFAFEKFTFTKSTATDVITPDAESMKVSFAQTTNIAGFGKIDVKSVARGEKVPLTAHKGIDGYKFVGWKRGADTSDKNAWVDITGDEYEVWTNTYLTAIYEPVAAPTEKVVEFWDQNGAYMGQKNEASYKEVLNFPLTLTGYGDFKGWFIDKDVKLTEETELSAGTTNAVAQYDDGVVSGVTLNGITVDEADVYNEEFSFEKSIGGFTCWKRDGQIISYDANYTYNVWDATAITEDDDVIADKVPVAILEYNDDYNAYMLEYDDGDYEIVEAGIIFDGDSVDSCAKKYTSQRKVSHNQFTAPKDNYTSAKGYIIWKDAFGAFHIDYYTVQ